MSEYDGQAEKQTIGQRLIAPAGFIGSRTLGLLDQVGAVYGLLIDTLRWLYRGLTRRRVRLGVPAIMSQIVRVGVRSVFIVSLVSGCVGLILVLQMAPPLDQFGRKDLVANILGVAILRELGPLIAAIVLTGFAGAAIAAELGTMVVGEEIEALQAQALNPVRFLVIPRFLAAVVSMTCLAVIANIVSITCGLLIALLVLNIPVATFMDNLLQQAKMVDFLTGVAKSVVFGSLIGLIACSNGLRVTGGAAGVGRATTNTVVQSVVAIVLADLLFTAIFFAWELN
ncbi:MAG: ABC transporter permease [Phycisphaerales bacterium]|nr:ABC transporter permease [Phycisphaerales bacterium]